MILIDTQSDGLSDAIRAVREAFGNQRPALVAIGEELVEFSKQRFAVSADPYGNPWARNKPSTIAHFLRLRLGRKAHTQQGALSARGQRVIAGKLLNWSRAVGFNPRSPSPGSVS